MDPFFILLSESLTHQLALLELYSILFIRIKI